MLCWCLAAGTWLYLFIINKQNAALRPHLSEAGQHGNFPGKVNAAGFAGRVYWLSRSS